eukprot:scaffold499293_cov32-Prasinocladus_malaysianus.AAC.1
MKGGTPPQLTDILGRCFWESSSASLLCTQPLIATTFVYHRFKQIVLYLRYSWPCERHLPLPCMLAWNARRASERGFTALGTRPPQSIRPPL